MRARSAHTSQTTKLISLLSGKEGCMRSCRVDSALVASTQAHAGASSFNNTNATTGCARGAGWRARWWRARGRCSTTCTSSACWRARPTPARARARAPRAPPGQGARRPRPARTPACQPVHLPRERSLAVSPRGQALLRAAGVAHADAAARGGSCCQPQDDTHPMRMSHGYAHALHTLCTRYAHAMHTQCACDIRFALGAGARCAGAGGGGGRAGGRVRRGGQGGALLPGARRRRRRRAAARRAWCARSAARGAVPARRPRACCRAAPFPATPYLSIKTCSWSLRGVPRGTLLSMRGDPRSLPCGHVACGREALQACAAAGRLVPIQSPAVGCDESAQWR